MMSHLTKAKILKVGTFAEDGSPVGWHFDGGGRGIGIQKGPQGGTLVGGYTFQELRAIAARQV